MNDRSPDSFLQSVDKETQESILRLSQKLKGLQVEVEAKIENLVNDTNHSSPTLQEQQLRNLSAEIKKALVNITTLVRMVLAEGMTPNEFNEINAEAITTFRAQVQENTEKIINFKDEL